MALGQRIRNQLRDYVPVEMLAGFEQLAATTDALWKRLDAEKDAGVAWSLAIEWASSVLSLARLESSLLSGVLPHLYASIDGFEDRVTSILNQKEAAERAVYDMRGGSFPQPLNPERSSAREAEVLEAKSVRNETLIDLGEQLHDLYAMRQPAKEAISQIGLSLRALNHFVNTRFPQPTKGSPFQRMAGAPSVDLTQDPLEAFATRWVKGMDGRGSHEAQALRKAMQRDRRPRRDWDAEKRAHIEKVRARNMKRD